MGFHVNLGEDNDEHIIRFYMGNMLRALLKAFLLLKYRP